MSESTISGMPAARIMSTTTASASWRRAASTTLWPRRRSAATLVKDVMMAASDLCTVGSKFEPFAAGRNFDPTVQRSLAAIMTSFTRVAADRRLGQSVVEAARRHDADAVVVDMILAAGIPEIVDSDIPTIVFVHCFYRAVQDLAASPVGWMLRLRGTDPLAAEHRGLLQVVSARADLDPIRGAPSVCHTGVVWQGVPRAAAPAAVPRILVSLSTCAFAGQRRMLQNILDAIAPLPVDATVTVGPAINAAGLR